MDTKADTLRVDRTIKTLRALALENLRNAILDFQFRPGDRLIERNLCEALGVSRTTVREALRHLESEGLVISPPHQGPTVVQLDPETAEQIYELRAMLEGMAGRACAQRASASDIEHLQALAISIRDALTAGDLHASRKAGTEFYETIFLVGGKDVAWSIVQSLNARISYLRAMTIKDPGRTVTGPAELQKIVDAIRSGNEAAAEKACVEHVKRAARIASAVLRHNSPERAEPQSDTTKLTGTPG